MAARGVWVTARMRNGGPLVTLPQGVRTNPWAVRVLFSGACPGHGAGTRPCNDVTSGAGGTGHRAIRSFVNNGSMKIENTLAAR